jgi:large subunit ribosomal protein L5
MSDYQPRLIKKYQDEVIPQLMKDFSLENVMQVPKLDRIVVNMGRKPVVTRAKKSIAGFKLREGMPIGVMVTLRGEQMYDFLDRLITVALPRTRDFKGTSPKAFDGRGNYTLGVREQIIFPEINYDKVDRIKGMNITFVTTAETDEQGRALLKSLGMPFRN